MVKTENGLVNCPNCDEFMTDWDHECEMEYETSAMDDAKDDNDMGTKKDECDDDTCEKMAKTIGAILEKMLDVKLPP